MTHGKTKKPSSHRKKKLRTRGLHLVGAILVILLGGIISWIVLEQIDKADPSTAPTTSKNTEAVIQRVELTGWQVALPVTPGIEKDEIIVSSEKGDGASSVPNRYKLSTKASQENMQRCDIEDGSLLTIRRTKELPSQLVDEFMASTSKIGDYYYLYRSNVQTIAGSNCTSEVRTELSDEAQLLERMVSAIQLK